MGKTSCPEVFADEKPKHVGKTLAFQLSSEIPAAVISPATK